MLRSDANRFLRDVLANPYNAAILARWNELALPDGWLVAGCLFQTAWNLQSRLPSGAGIKDYDLFYFDAGNRAEEHERTIQGRVDRVLADLPIVGEATNQARVHLWYEAYYGFPCPPLRDSRDGIDRFLVTETCVGVRPVEGRLEVYAPHGLAGVYDGTLSPNPLTPDRQRYGTKTQGYRERWPWLRATA